nr:tetratricopeptide repeat protein [uncultured Flavobacterium sp.]
MVLKRISTIFFYLFLLQISSIFAQDKSRDDAFIAIYKGIYINKHTPEHLLFLGDSLHKVAVTPRQEVTSNLIKSIGYINLKDNEKAFDLLSTSLKITDKHSPELQNERFKIYQLLKDVYNSVNFIDKWTEVVQSIGNELEYCIEEPFCTTIKSLYYQDLAKINVDNLPVAKKYYDEALQLVINNKDANFDVLRIYNRIGNLYFDHKKYNEAVKYYTKLLEHNELYYENSHLFNIVVNNNIAQAHLESNQLELAYKHVTIALNLVKTTNMIAYEEVVYTTLRDYYKKTGEVENENKANNKLLEFIDESKSDEKKTISKIVRYEQQKNKEEQEVFLTSNNQKIKLLALLCFLLALIAVGVYVYYVKNRKRYIKYYEELIANIQNEDNKISTPLLVPVSDNDEEVLASSLGISTEKENEILQNLEIFEQNESFVDAKISIASMATLLKTNTKYLTYILKKYRNQNFTDYINTMKIRYITKRLYYEPELLKFKINHIAELAGFSSHSRFAYIFKLENKVSPSEFINQLKKKDIAV